MEFDGTLITMDKTTLPVSNGKRSIVGEGMCDEHEWQICGKVQLSYCVLLG